MAGAKGFGKADLRLLVTLFLVLSWIGINVGMGIFGTPISQEFTGSLGALSLFLIKDWLFKEGGAKREGT